MVPAHIARTSWRSAMFYQSNLTIFLNPRRNRKSLFPYRVHRVVVGVARVRSASSVKRCRCWLDGIWINPMEKYTCTIWWTMPQLYSIGSVIPPSPWTTKPSHVKCHVHCCPKTAKKSSMWWVLRWSVVPLTFPSSLSPTFCRISRILCKSTGWLYR